MSLIRSLKEIFGMTPDSSEPENEGLPEALGPTARQYVYTGSLPERFDDPESLEICISVRRDAPDKPAKNSDMKAVRRLLREKDASIQTEDQDNALFTVTGLLGAGVLEDVAEHDAVVSVYMAREWGGE